MRASILGPLTVALLGVACGDDDDDTRPVIDPGDAGENQPEFSPDSFVDEVSNPDLPFQPGARWSMNRTMDQSGSK